MRKTIIFLVLFCLISLSSISASEIIEQYVIPGLHTLAQSCRFSFIESNDGQFHGFSITKCNDNTVELYDKEGTLLKSVPYYNTILQTISRISDNNDTLVIYTLTDTAYVFSYAEKKIDIFRLQADFITPNGDTSVVVSTNSIHASSEWDTPSQYPMTDLKFYRDSLYNIAYIEVDTDFDKVTCMPTMGCTTDSYHLYINHSLDLSTTLTGYDTKSAVYLSPVSELNSRVYFVNNYLSVMDDPWNSFTSSSTYVSVWVGDSCIASKNTENGGSSLLLSGDFIKNVSGNEFIYIGSAYDLLGNYEGKFSHYACYSISNDTVNEHWLIDPPPGFHFQFYHHKSNYLIGLTNKPSVQLFDCSSGTVVEEYSFPTLYNRAFLTRSSEDLPYLIGRIGDTVYIYKIDTPTDVNDPHEPNDPDLPIDFMLSQNYPNPFNPSTTISFSLPYRTEVKIEIYNLIGQKIATVADQYYEAGSYNITWNGRNRMGEQLPSGIYLYRLSTPDFSDCKKMVLLK